MLLVKLFIVSDTDHSYNDNANIREDEKILEQYINLFKTMEFSKSCPRNDESNESINLWKLPDAKIETILLNAVGSSTNAIQDYHSITQTCSKFVQFSRPPTPIVQLSPKFSYVQILPSSYNEKMCWG